MRCMHVVGVGEVRSPHVWASLLGSCSCRQQHRCLMVAAYAAPPFICPPAPAMRPVLCCANADPQALLELVNSRRPMGVPALAVKSMPHLMVAAGSVARWALPRGRAYAGTRGVGRRRAQLHRADCARPCKAIAPALAHPVETDPLRWPNARSSTEEVKRRQYAELYMNSSGRKGW